MLKVAITGNIAAGKSTVEKALMAKGYKVLDTDIVSHELLKDKNIKKKIITAFLDYDILEDDEISRVKLGRIVFDDVKFRKELEHIIHPEIKSEIVRFFNHLEAQRAKIAFASVPLLFEAGFDDIFNKILLVYSDDELRLQRLINRNNISLEHAKNRLKIQTSQEEKLSKADYVVYNNGSLIDLYENLDEVLKLL